MNSELSNIIKEAQSDYSITEMNQIITLCHLYGRVEGFINSENLHLFRQYRNTNSVDAQHLIDQALNY